MNTIDAMKQAQTALDYIHPDTPDQRDIKREALASLRDAIAREEAQTVEAVDDVLDRIAINRSEYGNKLRAHKEAGYTEGWAACMTEWADHMARMNAATGGSK